MIDIHTHILPCVDDGASSDEIAISMLEILEKSQITDVFLTPHFYSDTESLDDFTLRRNTAYKKFKKIYNQNINLHLGSEVYITQYLTRYKYLSELCFDQTKYMLVEFPFDTKISESEYKTLESLIYDYKITPIVAHIERYPFFNYDNNIVNALISIGCLIQVNSDSFISKKTKKIVLSLVKENKVNFIGSDSHDLINRPPTYTQAIKTIVSKLGENYLEKIKSSEHDLIKEIKKNN